MNKKGADISSWSDEEIEKGFVIRRSKGRTIVIYADGTKVHYKDSEFVKKSYSEKKQYVKDNSQRNKVKNADIDRIPPNKIEEIYESKTKHNKLLNTERVQNAKSKAMESRDYLTKKASKLTEQKYQLEADKDDPDRLRKINKELDDINDKLNYLKGGK